MSRVMRLVVISAMVCLCFAVLASSSDQPARGKKYALLVGVNEYDSSKLSRLRYPENDVEELAKLLTKSGDYETVRVLTSKRGEADAKAKPTGANVRAALEEILKGRTRHDTVLIALAGHGVQLLVKDPKGELGAKPYAFFCTADSDLNDVKYLSGHSETMLNLDALFKTLGDSNPGTKLVLMDACRNELTVTASTRSLATKRVEIPDGVLALFSCGRDQFAYESDRLKHGIFFHYVLEGLRGAAKNSEGEVDWALLTSYVTRQVPRNIGKYVEGGARQNPAVFGSHEGESPLLVRIESRPPITPVEKGEWGKEIVSKATGMKLMRIIGKGEKATFQMGSPKDEMNRGSEELQHEVELIRALWMGKHEVTQGEFKRVMGYNPSYFSRDGVGKAGVVYVYKPAGGKEKIPAGDDPDSYPAEQVSWEEANEFCERLTKLESGRVYRLPSEAEREYSCRGPAGDYQIFHFGNQLSATQANFNGNYPYGGADKGPYLERPCKVGTYGANRFGLHDMHGNVYEWCADWYDAGYYTKSSHANPKNTDKASHRVFRGGGWHDHGQDCRSAYRYAGKPSHRSLDLGFRVVAVPPR